MDPCVQLTCGGMNDSSSQAIWSTVFAGESNVTGTCYPNSVGTPTRDCDLLGAWSASSGSCISTGLHIVLAT